MQKIFLRILIFIVAVFITEYLLVGITFTSISDGLIVGLLFAFVNTFIKPILKIFTFPLTLLTLGLFPLILNIVIVLLISQAVPGFRIFGDWFFMGIWALAFSLCLAIINTILDTFIKITT